MPCHLPNYLRFFLSLRQICAVLTAVFCFSATAQADDARPLYVDIREQPGNQSAYTYNLQWRVPPLVKLANYPRITLPEQCQPVAMINLAGQTLGQRRFQCPQTLSGQTLSIDYPQAAPALSTIIKFANQRGEHYTQLLAPGNHRWQIPIEESVSSVAKDYTRLGVEHIWAGWDHLLFVVCLLWIAGTGRRMLITITGFTVAHSITLILSALQLVRVPVPPVEATIALSIVFLAVEITKQRKHSLTWRYPIAVSSSFGLLHGFGFAAALSEIGLPQTELVTGLLFFNVGVEIGQVVFAGAVIAVLALLRQAAEQWSIYSGWQSEQGQYWMRLTCSYSVGSVASLWLIERCLGFMP